MNILYACLSVSVLINQTGVRSSIVREWVYRSNDKIQIWAMLSSRFTWSYHFDQYYFVLLCKFLKETFYNEQLPNYCWWWWYSFCPFVRRRSPALLLKPHWKLKSPIKSNESKEKVQVYQTKNGNVLVLGFTHNKFNQSRINMF